MWSDPALWSVFLIGLLGSGHCFAMCGGIAGALTFGLPAEVRARTVRLLPYLLLYNAGRIGSYALAGALAGALGGSLFGLLGGESARLAGRIVSGGFLIALGLYVAGWWPGLAALERLGGRLWRMVEPLARRLLPVHTPAQALVAGLAWGWLPCGMVYSALALALSAGSAASGATLMAAFGVGTLPALLVVGAATEPLGRILRHPHARRLAGLLILGFGLYALLAPAPLHSHR